MSIGRKLGRGLSRLRDAGPGSRPAEVPDAVARALSGDGAPRPAEAPTAPAEESRRARVDRMRRLLDAMEARGRLDTKLFGAEGAPPVPLDDHGELPGELVETPHGPIHRVEEWHEPHHCHGRVPVRGALDVCAETVAQLALDPSFEAVDFRDMLLIDTETTGLAGGTGTIPFLVGMAWFEDDSLVVRQLFLRRLGQESPMLREVGERLAAASCVVSYNGKSFDWPLLRTRFVMNRVAAPALPPHLDLLHCSRRLFRERMASVRLVDMEREVLGMLREQDVPGSEIPAIYLGFLKGRGVGKLPGVIEHNRNDLVALAALLSRLAEHFREVKAADDPLDHLAYARVAERAGAADKAVAFAIAAADGGGDERCTADALLLAARIARRHEDVDAEERALLRALEAAPERAAVHLELAKLYEHRKKDLSRALAHAGRTADEEGEEACAKRRARLERRLARAR